MRTTRRPSMALAIGAAALALALPSCSGDAADDGTTTPAATSTEAASVDVEPTTAEEGRSEGYAPVGQFPVLSLAPMGTDDSPSSEVAPDRLAEISAGVAGTEPTDVTCEGTLMGGSRIPVGCAVASTQDVVTAYPVLSGPAGTEDHSLVVAGELASVQAEMVMDEEVSVHYGPTALFFDDPALLEQEGVAVVHGSAFGTGGSASSGTTSMGWASSSGPSLAMASVPTARTTGTRPATSMTPSA